jgi:hypothetical protein
LITVFKGVQYYDRFLSVFCHILRRFVLALWHYRNGLVPLQERADEHQIYRTGRQQGERERELNSVAGGCEHRFHGRKNIRRF